MSGKIVWADIPCVDLARAMKFYEHVMGVPVEPMPGGDDVALFNMGGDPSGPMIVSADLYRGGEPSHTGPTIYFGADGDIDGIMSRVEEAGGKVLEDKRFMGPMVGWIAFFEDTEGNRIGVQQPG